MGYSKIPSVWTLQIPQNLDNTEKNHEKGFSEQMNKQLCKAISLKDLEKQTSSKTGSQWLGKGRKKNITIIEQFRYARHCGTLSHLIL